MGILTDIIRKNFEEQKLREEIEKNNIQIPISPEDAFTAAVKQAEMRGEVPNEELIKENLAKSGMFPGMSDIPADTTNITRFNPDDPLNPIEPTEPSKLTHDNNLINLPKGTGTRPTFSNDPIEQALGAVSFPSKIEDIPDSVALSKIPLRTRDIIERLQPIASVIKAAGGNAIDLDTPAVQEEFKKAGFPDITKKPSISIPNPTSTKIIVDEADRLGLKDDVRFNFITSNIAKLEAGKATASFQGKSEAELDLPVVDPIKLLRVVKPDGSSFPFGTTQRQMIEQGAIPITSDQIDNRGRSIAARQMLKEASDLINIVYPSGLEEGNIASRVLKNVINRSKLNLQQQFKLDSAATLLESLQAELPILVRKFGETGALATKDVDRMSKAFLETSDNRTTAKDKLALLNRMLDAVDYNDNLRKLGKPILDMDVIERINKSGQNFLGDLELSPQEKLDKLRKLREGK